MTERQTNVDRQTNRQSQRDSNRDKEAETEGEGERGDVEMKREGQRQTES